MLISWLHAHRADHVLMEEFDLLTKLIIAASNSRGPLSQDEIDHVLGVDVGGRGRSANPA